MFIRCLDFEEKFLGHQQLKCKALKLIPNILWQNILLFQLFHFNLHVLWKLLLENGRSKANENETILKNDSCDFFPDQVFMEEEPLIKTMEKNRSLETQ